MRQPTTLLALMVTISLIGCSGGGGGGGGEGENTTSSFLQTHTGLGRQGSRDIATFLDGSSVVAGQFSDSITFNMSAGNQRTFIATSNVNGFVAHIDSNGLTDWVAVIQSSSIVNPHGVDAFADGSCVVTGRFEGDATFAPGDFNETTLTDVDGMGDIFVAKYAASGGLIWAKRAGRNESDSGYSVSGDSDGSSYVAGTFKLISVFGSGEPNLTILNGASSFKDAYIARYDSFGSLAWAKAINSTGSATAVDVATLANGDALVCGYYSLNVTFGPGEANETTLSASGTLDTFVARYRADGQFLWARRAGGSSFTEAFSLAVFDDDSFIVGGFFRDMSVFGPGEAGETTLTTSTSTNQAYLARYHANGELDWVRSDGGAGHDSVRSVATLPDGRIAVSGEHEGIAVFGFMEPSETTLVGAGGRDGFVATYSGSGALHWVRGIESTDNNYIHGIAAGPNGTCVVCGEFTDLATFNPGHPNETMRASVAHFDSFIARYSPSGGL